MGEPLPDIRESSNVGPAASRLALVLAGAWLALTLTVSAVRAFAAVTVGTFAVGLLIATWRRFNRPATP